MPRDFLTEPMIVIGPDNRWRVSLSLGIPTSVMTVSTHVPQMIVNQYLILGYGAPKLGVIHVVHAHFDRPCDCPD